MAGPITTGYTYNVTPQQARAARALALGFGEDRAAMEVQNCLDENKQVDKKKLNSAKRKLRKWINEDPKFQNVYAAIIKEIALDGVGRANRTIMKQMDSENPWIAQNASRDFLNRYTGLVLPEINQETVIRIEGMPELGSPDSVTE